MTRTIAKHNVKNTNGKNRRRCAYGLAVAVGASLLQIEAQASATSVSCSTPGADNFCHSYAGQNGNGTTNLNGIRGYVNASVSPPALNSKQGVLWWIGLSGDTNGYWVQAGDAQGTVWREPGSLTSINTYVEVNEPCGYIYHNLGTYSPGNVLFTENISSAATSPCYIGSTLYTERAVYVRLGGSGSPPVGGVMGLPSGTYRPEAETETIGLGGYMTPLTNAAYFGMNGTSTAGGYNLSVNRGALWAPWTTTTDPATASHMWGIAPPTFIRKGSTVGQFETVN